MFFFCGVTKGNWTALGHIVIRLFTVSFMYLALSTCHLIVLYPLAQTHNKVYFLTARAVPQI